MDWHGHKGIDPTWFNWLCPVIINTSWDELIAGSAQISVLGTLDCVISMTWMWCMDDPHVLDVLFIHWEHPWLDKCKIRCPDCKICTDLQHRKWNEQDQNIQSMICVWSTRPGRVVRSLGTPLNYYEQDQMSWLQDQHRSASQDVFTVRSARTEHGLCVINASWTCCVFIENIPESVWARSDVLIARSAQISSIGCVYCRISTYWAWSVCDQNVLDVMWIHWELA